VKQAPGWNQIVKLYGGNKDVAFGDVNLQKSAVREAFGTPQNPGKGGWPTIRYYNKETGYGGAAYEKITESAMCEELKDVQNMKNYVNSAGATTSCDVVREENCSEKELKYIQKWKGTEDAATNLKTELDRLAGMDKSDLEGEKKQWAGHRQGLLKAILGSLDGAVNAEL
jgi:hypothetical protein